jgi:DUF3072 family protein
MSIQTRLTDQMTDAQALKLRSLSQEAYQPKLYERNLSQAEAARRIDALNQEIALAESFRCAADLLWLSVHLKTRLRAARRDEPILWHC